MEISKNLCGWEMKKAAFILSEAAKLDMDISGYGFADVNQNSGHTYVWLEEYPFTLYMPVSCQLVKSDIRALWTNPETGEEEEIQLQEGTTLSDLYAWTAKMEAAI